MIAKNGESECTNVGTKWKVRGRPDYLQKLKVPEEYEKMMDYSNTWHGTADGFSAVSKPIFATKYSCESSWRDLQDLHLCVFIDSFYTYASLGEKNRNWKWSNENVYWLKV